MKGTQEVQFISHNTHSYRVPCDMLGFWSLVCQQGRKILCSGPWPAALEICI